LFTDEKMATDEIPQTDDAVTKFLFDLSFDEEPRDEEELDSAQVEEPDIPPLPPEPTFSEADLNAARSQAFEEGHAAGLNEAGAGIEQRASAALEAVAANLALLGAQQDDANRNILKDVIALNKRILEMLVPAYLERHGTAEIDALVNECLTRILDPGETVVEVPAEVAEMLEPRLCDTAARVGFAGTLDIRSAADLTAGDVRLSWQNGGAARLSEELWAEISEVVDRAIHSLDAAGGPAPDAPQPTLPADGEPAVQAAEADEHVAETDEAAQPTAESDENDPRPDRASPDAQAELGAG